MKISYNWLKGYIDIDIAPEKVAELLTDSGLEVEGLEHYESVKGNLEGVVIGEVLTKEQHPNADKLSCTTVDVGGEEPLNIVCGAPNVAVGQKVAVAVVGTTLYSGEESFKIKKSKIRGEVSEGMICAEDELGLGTSHDGIMVLEEGLKPGTLANEYFSIYKDVVFEIGLTPNRTDAISHYGVARDLKAVLNTQCQEEKYVLRKPDISNFKVDNTDLPVNIIVEDTEACPRYTGLTISGVKVEESPQWLKDNLNAIGARPINNVVDITNYVLHELGQPLHAFDFDELSSSKVIVKQLAEGTPFTTLDEVDRKLSKDDLMICNEGGGMCIGGVFGGVKSGVSEKTTKMFLESAYFNPVSVRKTAKYHGLNTDASFRFERGADPNIAIYALKRAALLIKEIAGGEISSEIVDIYPIEIPDFKVDVEFEKINGLIGKQISPEQIKFILNQLEIKIEGEFEGGLNLSVPPFRADVHREADIVEEILRIYGYNNIELPEGIRTSAVVNPKPDKEKIKNTIFDYLAANGFHEVMSNSLTKIDYYEDNTVFPAKSSVQVLNPLSKELNCLRQTLLYSGLETIVYNQNRQINDLKIFEFGNVYKFNQEVDKDSKVTEKYNQEEHLAIFMVGRAWPESYNTNDDKLDFNVLKSYINNIFKLSSLEQKVGFEEYSDDLIANGLKYSIGKQKVAEVGILDRALLKKFDVEQAVFYANIKFSALLDGVKKNVLQFKALTKFPEVRRDLALLVFKSVKYVDIESLAYKIEKNLLKRVNLFDIYEGDKIPEGKKSYAISFHLQDERKTLKDKEIDKIMNKLIQSYQKEFNAEIR